MLDFHAECERVATAAGYAPRPPASEQVRAILTERGSRNSASMRNDLEAGSRTEGDAILGDFLRRARELCVATPLLHAAACHVQVYERRRAVTS